MPGILLHNQQENGIVLLVQEALGVEMPKSKWGQKIREREREIDDESAPRRIPKMQNSRWAGVVSLIEIISCWTEGMSAWLLSGAVLKYVAEIVAPQGRRCILGDDIQQLPKAIGCAIWRDKALIIAIAGSCAVMAVALSMRYAGFFEMRIDALLKGMLGPPKSSTRGISATTRMALLILCAGMTFQVWGQRATGKALFSADNYKDNKGSLSASRSLDLVFFAPLREEILHRYFMLHIIRNRVGPWPSVAIGGVFFGVVHLFNAYGSRYSSSYVYVQVLQASLIGSFLSSRMLLRAPFNGILEPLLIHIMNNLVSSALPSSTELDFSDWFVSLSLAMTIVVFSILLIIDLIALRKSVAPP